MEAKSSCRGIKSRSKNNSRKFPASPWPRSSRRFSPSARSFFSGKRRQAERRVSLERKLAGCGGIIRNTGRVLYEGAGEQGGGGWSQGTFFEAGRATWKGWHGLPSLGQVAHQRAKYLKPRFPSSLGRRRPPRPVSTPRHPLPRGAATFPPRPLPVFFPVASRRARHRRSPALHSPVGSLLSSSLRFSPMTSVLLSALEQKRSLIFCMHRKKSPPPRVVQPRRQ